VYGPHDGHGFRGCGTKLFESGCAESRIPRAKT